MNPTKGPKPEFQDITLYDQETGEPFIFTAKEQEFFWRQGFTNVPKHSPERRKMLREQRFAGKDVSNVTCKQCGKVGKILQKPPYPREVYCENCFHENWEKYLDAHPDIREMHEQAAREIEAERAAAKALAEQNAPTPVYEDYSYDPGSYAPHA